VRAGRGHGLSLTSLASPVVTRTYGAGRVIVVPGRPIVVAPGGGTSGTAVATSQMRP